MLTYIPGTLEITPYEGEVLVTVTGNNGAFRYDGMNHTVSGYTMEASVPFFTMNDIRFTGKAEITKARPGDYIQFEDDTDKYAIRRIAYMELHTQIAGLISMYLYNTPLPSVIKRWKFTAVFEGNGKKAVSDNKCLVIEYNTIPEKI